MTRARLALAALLCLTTSSAWADLRTYDVDPQYSQEIFAALRELLEVAGQDGVRYGRVELLPTGQLLVNATPETLDEVEQLLRAIRARPPGATPRVELRYWAVLGTPPGTTVTARPGSTQPPSGLQEVLTELKRIHGELQFQVIGTAAVVSESGQPGGVDGIPLSVSQVAHVQGDTLNAQIELRLSGATTWNNGPQRVGELDVRTSLKRGEFLVLGESTQQSGQVAKQGGGPVTVVVGSLQHIDGTLFYIAHWPE
jgi:hypothetical protein